MARPGRHALRIDIPIEVYNQVKEACDKRMCTMTKYVIRALIETLKKEEKYK